VTARRQATQSASQSAWRAYYEALDDLVSELRAGNVDQPTFFELVDETTPKVTIERQGSGE
jgi:hypothetical protein